MKLPNDSALSCRCSVFLAARAERQARIEQTSISTVLRKALVAYLARVDATAPVA